MRVPCDCRHLGGCGDVLPLTVTAGFEASAEAARAQIEKDARAEKAKDTVRKIAPFIIAFLLRA